MHDVQLFRGVIEHHDVLVQTQMNIRKRPIVRRRPIEIQLTLILIPHGIVPCEPNPSTGETIRQSRRLARSPILAYPLHHLHRVVLSRRLARPRPVIRHRHLVLLRRHLHRRSSPQERIPTDLRAADDGLEQKARRLALVLLDQHSIRQDGRQLIVKHSSKERHDVASIPHGVVEGGSLRRTRGV